MHRSTLRLFAVLFFLSGLAGLVYEVSWTRLLRLPMGNTVHSMTTVLAAFMGGLALGAWIAGRWIERRGSPLGTYARLEAAIGVFCFVLPWLVQAETPLFRWAYRQFADTPLVLHLVKLVACGFVVIVPATLMGATLPVLSRAFIADTTRIAAGVGTLYAVNALGAAAGALLAGFVLVPALGLRGAMYTGVALSLAVALLAWRAQRRAAMPVARPAARREAPKSRSAPGVSAVAALPLSRRTHWIVLAGYALSGLAAMVFQVAWVRVFALVLGTSTYAFSLVVAAFILGLCVGSAVAARIADRWARPALVFALLELGIGFTALAMVPLFQRFPEWMLTLVPRLGENFGLFQLVQFTLVVLALLLPTACMGACLPVVSRALAAGSPHAAAAVGTAYAWNALGTIAGALLGGFVLLPALGAQRTIVFGAAINLAIGALVLALALPRRRALVWMAAAVAAGAGAIVVTPGFDPSLLSSGTYLYADATRQNLGPGRSLQKYMRDQYAVVLHREGVVTTTTVRDGLDGTRSLVINGKVDASDGSDMATQVLLGHIPALLHREPRDIAVIGLASGVTAGAAAQHPSVRSLDCIEIAPETVDACRLFDHVNHRVLDDPRVRVVVADGRNHLAFTDRQYDVIVSEPSNPWIAGVANLFTQEFFAACRDRLRPGGVAGIWLHLYGSSPEIVRNVARTFQSVFPAATLWESIFAADYLLVGCATDMAVDWDDLTRRLQAAPVAADLARVGVRSAADFFAHHVASGVDLQQWIGAGEIYRDDHNRLEFDAPRMMHRRLAPQDMQSIRDLAQPRQPVWLRLPPGGVTASDAAQVTAMFRARDEFWRAFVLAMRGDHPAALEAYRGALRASPSLAATVPIYVEDAAKPVHAAMLARGDTLGFERSARELVTLQPALTGIRLDLARLLAARGQLAAAEVEYRAVLELRPRDPETRLDLAALVDRMGRRADAETEVRQVLAARPGYPPALLSLGNYLVERGQLPEGEAQYRSALARDPEFPVGWYLLGNVLHMRGEHAEAARAAERAWRLEPGVPATRDLLVACYRALGETDKAAAVAAR